MGQQTVRAGVDTMARSATPARPYGGAAFLNLNSGAAYAFLNLKSPAPRGSVILSATLKVHARGASAGARTLTARRVASTWKASKLTWNNKPGVTGTSATDTIGAVSDGDAIEFDVTAHLQSVANGSPHYGWRITTSAGAVHKIYGLDAGRFKPTLTVVWALRPEAPTDLAPSAGAVSVAKPILTFAYNDVSEATDLAAIRVQIDAGNVFTTGIDFDSLEVATTEPELDLNDTAYAGLADGATTYWRAQVKDSAGLWSLWSDVATFSRDNLGTLAIDYPAADPSDFVTDSTPEIAWTLTGETQAAWQVRITLAADRTHLLYDSGKITGTDTSHGIPVGVLKDEAETYSVQVRVWDDEDREATPGAPVYVEAWRDFTITDDAGVDEPTSLTATQVGTSPQVLLEWDMADPGDHVTIVRDGQIIAALLDPDDLLVTGTTYSYTDWTAAPEVQHVYEIRRNVAGANSPPSNTGTITTFVKGIWLADPDRALAVVLLGDDGGSWASPDQAATYRPVGSPRSIRITSGLSGLEGSISGSLVAATGFPDRVDQVEAVYELKERPDQTYRLVVGDLNIPVTVGDLTVFPSAAGTHGDPVNSVSFSFVQDGELPFEARL